MIRYLTIHPESFDPETISVLSAALDAAWESVRTKPIAFKIDGNLEAARDLLAKHIVDMARQGEQDQGRLVQGALQRLKL